MIQFQSITKQYSDDIVAAENVSFKIEKGEFVFLIGPSGSGKTTLIKLLIRDELPTSGHIYFNDIDITKVSRSKVYKIRREIGVVFQDYKLVPDKTTYENVAFAMEAAGRTDREIKEQVPYILEIVGLDHRMQSFPKELSGGEQQRVAIARAISNNPQILIADEPTGNLDPASAWDIIQVLNKINNWGTTVLMSTHGTDIVNSLQKRVIQMEEGKIIRDDDKGSYEFASKFESMVLESAENLEKPKTSNIKTTFKVNLNSGAENAQDTQLQDVETVNTEELPRRGLLGFFFRRKPKAQINEDIGKQSDTDEEGDAQSQVQDNGTTGQDEPESIQEMPADQKNKQEVDSKGKDAAGQNTPSNSKETFEKDKPGSKKGKESKKGISGPINNDKTKLATKIVSPDKKPENLENGKNLDKEKQEDKKMSKDLSSTLVENLTLPSRIIKELKKSGYNTVRDIVEQGPEGLTEHMQINPEEVVQVAKSIENLIEKK